MKQLVETPNYKSVPIFKNNSLKKQVWGIGFQNTQEITGNFLQISSLQKLDAF